MEEYIGEIIGATAIIIAALIGLIAKKGSRNKQVIKSAENSTVYQANGDITVERKKGNE